MSSTRAAGQAWWDWTTRTVSSRAVLLGAVFVLAAMARGEWLLLAVYLGKDHLQGFLGGNNGSLTSEGLSSSLDNLGLQDLHYYVIGSVVVALASFWGLGVAFDRYFYTNRKDKAREWKCQPDRWLTESNERHEFLLGSANLFMASIVSGVMACYIVNGGNTCLYFDVSDHGWLYLVLSVPILYLWNSGSSYYTHRASHAVPYLYRKFHKVHHRYLSPTLYSAAAMHPVEFFTYQTLLMLPAFRSPLPIHAGLFVFLLIWGYYYGMWDHSGIKMEPLWPWQPSSMHHDDHHRYPNCNFGLNSYVFDWMHGTLRRKDKNYGESVFGGKGRAETETDEDIDH